jgi:muramoyltetrapeptide carboxypeptidase
MGSQVFRKLITCVCLSVIFILNFSNYTNANEHSGAYYPELFQVKYGSKIAIVAPGTKQYKNNNKSNKAIVQRVMKLVRGLGFIPLDYTSYGNHPYYADTAENRAEKFIEAANNSDAIWCLNGGDGSAQIIEYLDRHRLPKNHILIGFSDITSLLIYFEQYMPELNWRLIHGETLKRFLENKHLSKAKELSEFLTTSKNFQRELELLNTNQTPEKIEGRLLGGNIPRITRTLGTSREIKISDNSGENKFLMLEDVGEKTRNIVGEIEQLADSKQDLLAGAKVVIFGQFSGAQAANKDVYWPVDKEIKNMVQNNLQYKFPETSFFLGKFFGHTMDDEKRNSSDNPEINTPWGENYKAIIQHSDGEYKLFFSNHKNLAIVKE